MAKLVPLTRGKFAIVSDGDYERVMQYKCHADYVKGRWYAGVSTGNKDILLHRFIMNPPEDMDVDHIDNNGLNDARYNLRVVTRSTNLQNKINRVKSRPAVAYNYEPDPIVHDKTRIILIGGSYTLVDEGDWDWLYPTRWCLGSSGTRPVIFRGVGITRLYIHRAIMEHHLGRKLRRDEFVDHINGNPQDNRFANLRLASNIENCWNRKINRNNKSGYKGVSWHKGQRKWVAQIGYMWKRLCIGYFETKEEAARAYDTKAIELFGKFARLNFPRS